MQKQIQEAKMTLGPLRGSELIVKPSAEELNYARVFRKKELLDK